MKGNTNLPDQFQTYIDHAWEGHAAKLETASELFDISVRQLRRMAEDGEITLFQYSAKQGSACRVDPGQVREALTKVKG